ncbi:YcjF family protein [Roseovarius sp. E0-M6]|uniref:YcjF family protein n=1 Tax=Roseovarius sp. E0-M6 TaxID=3127118 RepID=UPI0030100267
MTDDRPAARGPVLFDVDADSAKASPDPASAPPVPEPEQPEPQGRAMQTVATIAARKPSRLGQLFWGLLLSILGVALSVAAWDFATALLERSPLLGYAVTGLIGALLVVLLVIALREMAAFSRLRRMDRLHHMAEAALIDADLKAARDVVGRIDALYAHREDMRWSRERLAERQGDQFDAEALLGLAEAELMTPLDAAARVEIEAAARQVATVTAVVPLALADVVAALTSNLRMIRRVAEIYGGRSGTLGSWRLTRAVMTHLVATGAVAIGDDLISSVAGGGVLSKVSRRFGEGVVNGALTARVGVAAMEVCRPMPFARIKRPSVSGLVKRALTGLFGSG